MPSVSTTSVSVPPLQRGRRRRFSDDEKRALLFEAFTNEETVSELGRRYGIAVGLLFRWQRSLGITRPRLAVDRAPPRDGTSEQRLAELELQLGCLAKHNQILQERLARLESMDRSSQTSDFAAVHHSNVRSLAE